MHDRSDTLHHELTTESCSICRDRGWFNGYKFFESHIVICDQLYPVTCSIQGVGAVDLPVKISNKGNSKGHKVFRLTTVLYVPDAPYNIVGGCWTGDWSSCSKDLRTLFLEDKEPIARIKDRGGFAVIRISGFP